MNRVVTQSWAIPTLPSPASVWAASALATPAGDSTQPWESWRTNINVAIAQIPVAWAIAKGTLPIIGAMKVSHVEDAAKAAQITLTADEVKELEKLADTLGINAVRMQEKEMK